MNTNEFKKAFHIAKSNADLSTVSIDHLYGYGLKSFEPVTTTLEAIAAVMRWQALRFDGSWDMDEINDIKILGKKKFEVIDGEFTILDGEFTPEQLTAIKVSACLRF